MKQFGKILKFELKGYLKNKVFVGVTIFLVVAIAVAMFIPEYYIGAQVRDNTAKGSSRNACLRRRRNPFGNREGIFYASLYRV